MAENDFDELPEDDEIETEDDVDIEDEDDDAHSPNPIN